MATAEENINRYTNSKIYKLKCDSDYYYIDSTTTNLLYRLNSHKQTAKKDNETRHNKFFNKIGWDKVRIELIELFPCNTIKELQNRKLFYIKNAAKDGHCLNNFHHKYNEGKIYRLECNDGYYYIGSTIRTLKDRLKHHIRSSISGTSRLYIHVNKIGSDKVKIELIENYSCESLKELLEKENEYIIKSKDDPMCLNENRSFTTKKDKQNDIKKYYEEHKNEIKEYHVEYNTANKEHIDAYHTEYRVKYAEKRRNYSKKYNEEHPEKVKIARKIRYEKNKEKELEINKKYAKDNPEKINEYRKKWNEKQKLIRAETRDERKAEKAKKQQKEKHVKDKLLHVNVVEHIKCIKKIVILQVKNMLIL